MNLYGELAPQTRLVLAHHGILGQKWGKRNGPPYPLGKSDHSASEKKAGWEKSLDNGSSASYNKSKSASSVNAKGVQGGQLNRKYLENRGLTDSQKRALKIGATVAVTALAAYGVYKLKQSGKLDPLIDKGKSTVDQLLGNGDFAKQKVSEFQNGAEKAASKIDSATGLKLGTKETYAEAVKNVNPSGGQQNCRACSIASVLRMRGYDVEALNIEGGVFDDAINDCFKDAKVTVMYSPTKEKLTNYILKHFEEGSFGSYGATFQSSVKDRTFGHATNWMVKDGSIIFFDGQDGRTDAASLLDRIVPGNSLEISRLDNAEIDPEGIKKYIKNR